MAPSVGSSTNTKRRSSSESDGNNCGNAEIRTGTERRKDPADPVRAFRPAEPGRTRRRETGGVHIFWASGTYVRRTVWGRSSKLAQGARPNRGGSTDNVLKRGSKLQLIPLTSISFRYVINRPRSFLGNLLIETRRKDVGAIPAWCGPTGRRQASWTSSGAGIMASKEPKTGHGHLRHPDIRSPFRRPLCYQIDECAAQQTATLWMLSIRR